MVHRKNKYTVFEAVNEIRKEIFIAATSKSMFEAIADLRMNCPPVLKHRDLAQVRVFQSLEFNLSREAAWEFIEARIKRSPPLGWRYLTLSRSH